ncbi:MAG: hypothetical protein P9X24_04885 [Candidatus Hatepunaea meridiana]|nr:hypothetical protein [Candidatus Hatepunaea meridiana]
MESRQRGTHSNRFLRALADEGLTIFSTAQAKKLAESISVPSSYVTNLLMIMERNGWITRLRRGFYARSGAATGDIPVHPFAIATKLVTPSAISHWSALHHHGFTEQIPMVITAFTFKKVVTPSMRSNSEEIHKGKHAWVIDGIRYEFATVKEKYFFGIEEVWIDEHSRVPITDKERTILETFISIRMFGGISEALGITDSHINSLDISKFIDYACRYGMISTAKRIGWALEHAGVDPSLLEPLREIPAIGYHALDPTLPRRGACDSHWMIQNNLAERKVR